MSTDVLSLNSEILEYVRSDGIREDDDLRRLREETATHAMAIMQISPEQGQFLKLMVEVLGSQKALEVGTFTGYSAMCIAKGLGPGGKLVALDINESYTDIARRHWATARLADRIDLRLAPAALSLSEMVKTESGSYDFVFIDADKPGYDVYYEYALRLLRRGGVVACDNAFMEGGVINLADMSADSVAMRAFNRKLVQDARVSVCLLPIRDGLYLARKC